MKLFNILAGVLLAIATTAVSAHHVPAPKPDEVGKMTPAEFAQALHLQADAHNLDFTPEFLRAMNQYENAPTVPLAFGALNQAASTLNATGKVATIPTHAATATPTQLAPALPTAPMPVNYWLLFGIVGAMFLLGAFLSRRPPAPTPA